MVHTVRFVVKILGERYNSQYRYRQRRKYPLCPPGANRRSAQEHRSPKQKRFPVLNIGGFDPIPLFMVGWLVGWLVVLSTNYCTGTGTVIIQAISVPSTHVWNKQKQKQKVRCWSVGDCLLRIFYVRLSLSLSLSFSFPPLHGIKRNRMEWNPIHTVTPIRNW